MMSSKKELLESPGDSTDIYKRNIINRYQTRSYKKFNKHCYVLFLNLYQLEQKQIVNDSQPDELVDKIVEVHHASVGK